jgi:hypothetical protein
MLHVGHFDPLERAEQKALAREEDARLLASRAASPDQMNRQNGFFSKANLSEAVIIGRRAAILK